MYTASRRIRPLIKHIDGAWVRTWKDGETRVGLRSAAQRENAMNELFAVLDAADIRHEPWPHRGTSGWGSTRILSIPQ
jgi:hypothetical protein